MLILSDFTETSHVQNTLFTPGFSFITHKTLVELLQIKPGMFDGDPVVLPLPSDAPPELPRIILQDKTGSLKLEVAPLRINFHRIKINEDDKVNIHDSMLLAADILKDYLDKSGAKCGRIATVLKRFSLKDDPSIEIANHFCKEKFLRMPFDRPASFELHARKRYIFSESFEVNSWVRIKSGNVQYPSVPSLPIVLVEQDINTISEVMEVKQYTGEEISSFFRLIFAEFNDILQLYFPKNKGDCHDC
jgi:hypothetical protein